LVAVVWLTYYVTTCIEHYICFSSETGAHSSNNNGVCSVARCLEKNKHKLWSKQAQIKPNYYDGSGCGIVAKQLSGCSWMKVRVKDRTLTAVCYV